MTKTIRFDHEKLNVYQRSLKFITWTTDLLERVPTKFSIHSQLDRASTSIPLNIAEGNGRFTKPDRKNFFGIARGSVQECVPLLELAFRRNLLNETNHTELKAQLEEIARMLSGLINGLANRL